MASLKAAPDSVLPCSGRRRCASLPPRNWQPIAVRHASNAVFTVLAAGVTSRTPCRHVLAAAGSAAPSEAANLGSDASDKAPAQTRSQGHAGPRTAQKQQQQQQQPLPWSETEVPGQQGEDDGLLRERSSGHQAWIGGHGRGRPARGQEGQAGDGPHNGLSPDRQRFGQGRRQQMQGQTEMQDRSGDRQASIGYDSQGQRGYGERQSWQGRRSDERQGQGRSDERQGQGRSDERQRFDERQGQGRSDERQDQGRSDERQRFDERQGQGRSDERQGQGRSDERQGQGRFNERQRFDERPERRLRPQERGGGAVEDSGNAHTGSDGQAGMRNGRPAWPQGQGRERAWQQRGRVSYDGQPGAGQEGGQRQGGWRSDGEGEGSGRQGARTWGERQPRWGEQQGGQDGRTGGRGQQWGEAGRDGQQGPWRRQSPDAAMMALKESNSVSELMMVVETRQQEFRFMHGVAAVVHAAQLVLRAVDGGSDEEREGEVGGAVNVEETGRLVQKIIPLLWKHYKHFRPRELSNAVWALSKLDGVTPITDRRLLDALLEAAEAQLSAFNAQDASNLLLALAHMGERRDALVVALAVEAAPKLPTFKTQELANTTWALAKLFGSEGRGWEECDPRVQTFVDGLTVEATGRLSAFKPQELSNMIWALATLGRHNDEVVGALLGESGRKLGGFKPQHLSNTLWALATLNHWDQQFVVALLMESERKLAMHKPQELCITIWALATFQYLDRRLLSIMYDSCLHKLHLFKCQELCNVLWSMSRFGVVQQPLLQRMIDKSSDLLPSFDPQGLVIILPSIARLGIEQRPFVHKVIKEMGRRMQSLDTQAISNTVWALAHLYNPPFPTKAYVAPYWFQTILYQRIEVLIEGFIARDLAQTAWALGELRYRGPLVARIVTTAMRRVSDFSASEACAIAQSLAFMGHADPALFEALGTCLLAPRAEVVNSGADPQSPEYWRGSTAARDLDLQAIANTLHGHAMAWITCSWDEELMLTHLLPLMDAYDPHTSSHTSSHSDNDSTVPIAEDGQASGTHRGWQPAHPKSLIFPPSGLEPLAAAKPTQGASLQLSRGFSHVQKAQPLRQGLCQVFMYMLMLEAKGGRYEALIGTEGYQRLRAKCEVVWRATNCDPSPSRVQLQVLWAVQQLPGCAHAKGEHPTDDGLFFMDIGLELPGGVRVAIEVDGPQHFSNGGASRLAPQPTAQTLLRDRLLATRGFQVLSVPVKAWQEVLSAAIEQKLGEAAREARAARGAAGQEGEDGEGGEPADEGLGLWGDGLDDLFGPASLPEAPGASPSAAAPSPFLPNGHFPTIGVKTELWVEEGVAFLTRLLEEAGIKLPPKEEVETPQSKGEEGPPASSLKPSAPPPAPDVESPQGHGQEQGQGQGQGQKQKGPSKGGKQASKRSSNSEKAAAAPAAAEAAAAAEASAAAEAGGKEEGASKQGQRKARQPAARRQAQRGAEQGRAPGSVTGRGRRSEGAPAGAPGLEGAAQQPGVEGTQEREGAQQVGQRRRAVAVRARPRKARASQGEAAQRQAGGGSGRDSGQPQQNEG